MSEIYSSRLIIGQNMDEISRSKIDIQKTYLGARPANSRSRSVATSGRSMPAGVITT